MKSVDLPSHFGRQHRDFIKIMINYKEFKQLIVSTEPILLIPTKSQMISQVQAQRGGNPKSQPHLSIHPEAKPIKSVLNHRSREEDSIGVLTVPQDLCKKKLERIEQKNWLKYKDYHFNYLRVVKSKFPLILLQKYQTMKE